MCITSTMFERKQDVIRITPYKIESLTFLAWPLQLAEDLGRPVKWNFKPKPLFAELARTGSLKSALQQAKDAHAWRPKTFASMAEMKACAQFIADSGHVPVMPHKIYEAYKIALANRIAVHAIKSGEAWSNPVSNQRHLDFIKFLKGFPCILGTSVMHPEAVSPLATPRLVTVRNPFGCLDRDSAYGSESEEEETVEVVEIVIEPSKEDKPPIDLANVWEPLDELFTEEDEMMFATFADFWQFLSAPAPALYVPPFLRVRSSL
ncbi:hypothetical protein CC80DRAFT_509934 [Byssothecium circinans]|uniref:Uncharacterized protein n=1 Tax=Byssothecium circinans TaxID=147558 RepID=A0A6A5TD76_9PLEO|nr:hypothetical protein CC80DRAFT_509934 [Byssothecium circinans]